MRILDLQSTNIRVNELLHEANFFLHQIEDRNFFFN